MSLDTKSPAWSSYMLTQAIQAAVSINGLNISEIGVAVLEIFCEYKTPLNRFVYNFCIDFTKEFMIQHKDRLNELRVLSNWGNLCSQNNASVSLLRAWLCRDDKPEFILKTFMALLENKYFKDFKNENKYLFEDAEYKKEFIKNLANAELSDINKSMILSEIETYN